jgi:hypothetical protein
MDFQSVDIDMIMHFVTFRDWHGYTHALPTWLKVVENKPKIMKNSPEMAEI